MALDLLPFLLEDLVVAFVGVALVLTACFGLEGLAVEVEAASGFVVLRGGQGHRKKLVV